LQESRADRRHFVAILLSLALGSLARSTVAAPSDEAPAAPSFAREVAPVLDRWCVSCHGPREQSGGLRLDSYLEVMRGGDVGPAVEPGNAAGSLLIAKIERRDRPAMPPRRRLPATLTARLRAWIAAGAAP
jgi:mono/diheme cytochrome c family protein